MTASPAPGSTCDRHCASCAWPEGFTPQRAVARWHVEHRGTPLTHTTHGGTA